MNRVRIPLAAALISVVAGAVAEADTVKLKPEVYVKGPAILLGDIADIEGENAEALAAIEISNAAMPGDAKRIDSVLLASRIRIAGVDEGSLTIEGPSIVIARTLCQDVTGDRLATDLRGYIESEMPWDLENANVDVDSKMAAFPVPDGQVFVKWSVNPQYRWVGPGTFRGEVLVDGEVQRTVLLHANVEAYGDVLVAVDNVQRGSVINASDIQIQKRALSSVRGDSLNAIESAVGMTARGTILAGQIITSRDVVPREIIKRNQMVTVETRVGGLVVRNRAKALMNASEGDVISLVNLESKGEFQGVVQKNGAVLVE